MMGRRGYPENAGVLVVLVSTPSRSHIISIGFAQVRRNFIANAQELRLSCTNPSIYSSFENNRSSVLELPFPCWLHKPLIQIASLVHSMDLYFMSSVLFVLLVQVSHDQNMALRTVAYFMPRNYQGCIIFFATVYPSLQIWTQELNVAPLRFCWFTMSYFRLFTLFNVMYDCDFLTALLCVLSPRVKDIISNILQRIS